ncbi:hypothetical protein EMCRGX_G001436, partial [Ephydatia muelleri]
PVAWWALFEMSCSDERSEPISNHEPGLASTTCVSFKFQKRKPAPMVAGPVVGDQVEEKDFVTSLEDREIQSSKGKVAEKEHIVPLIQKNVWRQPTGKRLARDSRTQGTQKSEEEVALDKEAAEAIIKDVEAAAMRRGKDGGSEESMVVPLLLQNKPPVVPGKEEDELADVDLRPDQSTADDYDAMPIEKFGEAVLRGMGWTKGEAIGKTNKGLTEPIEFISRPRGLGLGATPKAAEEKKKKRIRKPGEEERKVSHPYVDKDGRVKHVKKLGEELPPPPLQGFVVGNVAKVLTGPHAELCGKIVGLDEDSTRVVLKMAINGQSLTFSRHALALVEDGKDRGGGSSTSGMNDKPSTEKKYGLVKRGELDTVAKATGRDDAKDRGGVSSRDQTQRDRDRERHPTKHPKLDAGHTHPLEAPPPRPHKGLTSSVSGLSKEKLWLAPSLRVRIVDRAYKKGLYYNSKVVILDVVSLGTCVCQTEDGRLLEDVHQSMLETVIPKQPRAVVQVLVGSNKGQLGTILDRDKHKDVVTVEMSLSKDVLTLGFDDVCEHVSTEHD